MAIPKTMFMSLSSPDSELYELSRHVVIQLNENDIARGKVLLNYPSFEKLARQAEIKWMLMSGLTYVQNALDS